MRGMSAIDGRVLEGADHLSQSIADILTTPIGSRVMRRDYGSLLPELIDAPFNGVHRLMLFGAIATALMRWEPRIELKQVQVAALSQAPPGDEPPGLLSMDIQDQIKSTGDQRSLVYPCYTIGRE